MARPIFDEELHALRKDVIEMGTLVEDALSGSLEAVRAGNETRAYLISQNDSIVDDQERAIERLCLRLLLREQPVAADLRAVTAALKMVTDLERIGDQAVEICEIALGLGGKADFALFPSLIALAERASSQVSEALASYVHLDLEKAQACVAGDQDVDALFDDTKREIMRHIIEHEPDETLSLDLFMIAKYLERVGDHAVNIAEWVEYAATGMYKGMNMGE